jgi:large subunit ribosomal protein L3
MSEGIIGRKVGTTHYFKEDGTALGVTVIAAGPCTVTQVKSMARDGYEAVQLGFGQAKRLNSPEKGHLKKLGDFKYLRELRFPGAADLQVGQKVEVSIFKPGDRVDVIGVSKGKGFAGVVKRHHFAGGPATHGQSDRHRAPGAIGATTTPGRVFKGLRMAGHMGNRRVTVKNLEVVHADPERHLLLVRGAVPGARNSIVVIRKAKA